MSIFQEFDDYRDADDAVHDLNGRELLGERYSPHIGQAGQRSCMQYFNILEFLQLLVKKCAIQNVNTFLGLPWNTPEVHAVVTADVVAADLGSTSTDLRLGPITA